VRTNIAINDSKPALTGEQTAQACKDYAQAMNWFRKAADQGNSRAQQNIGGLYEKGLGVNQDYARGNDLVPQGC
jgi:TPR repeat protein